MSQQRTMPQQRAPAYGHRMAPGLAADLVERASQGDTAAWERLVRSYVDLVWAVARNHRLSNGDAADAVELTWLRLVEHVDRLHSPERVGAWLARTARQESLRLGRGSRRNHSVPDLRELSIAVARELGLSAESPDDDLLRELGDAFLALPARSQDLMRLLVLDPPPTYAEIANALDIPVGSIGPTRGRSLKSLRDHLAPVPAPGPPQEDT